LNLTREPCSTSIGSCETEATWDEREATCDEEAERRDDKRVSLDNIQLIIIHIIDLYIVGLCVL